MSSNPWPLGQKCYSKTYLHILQWDPSVQFSREYLSPRYHQHVLSSAVWSLGESTQHYHLQRYTFEHDTRTSIFKCFSGKRSLWNVRISLFDTWLLDPQIGHPSKKSGPIHGSKMISCLRQLPSFTCTIDQGTSISLNIQKIWFI